MVVSIQIAKFKLRQYQQRVTLPNLMLTKVTRCTVGIVMVGIVMVSPKIWWLLVNYQPQ